MGWRITWRAHCVTVVLGFVLCPLAGNLHSHEMTLSATAELEAKSGSSVGGKLSIHQRDNAVHIFGELTGLTAGKHGMHVNTNGNCDSSDGMSAGGNFNPYGARRDGPGAGKERPLGDLGNIEADSSGTAKVDLVVDGITIAIMGRNSISDRSIVVYSLPDDSSEPHGNSGKRVACGFIEQGMIRM